MPQKVYKSAKTGRFVTREEAEANPETTFSTVIKKVKEWFLGKKKEQE